MNKPSERQPEELESAVWVAHGYVMNGGILHAAESLAPEELERAIAGYGRFGLAAAADLLAAARQLPESEKENAEARLDEEYAAAVPSEAFLEAAIERADPLPDSVLTESGTVSTRTEPVADAIQEFIEWSRQSRDLTAVPGKTRQQHRAAERTEKAVRKLLASWDEGGHSAFLGLLKHEDDVVRASAAGFLCESDPELAIPILRAIDDGPPSRGKLITFGILWVLDHPGKEPFRPLTRLREMAT